MPVTNTDRLRPAQSVTWMGAILVVVGAMLTAAGSAPLQAQNSAPQLYKSRNFQVMTDLPPQEARELTERLETMLKLVSAYYGRPCRKPIRMYVVKDLANWPAADLAQMSPDGLTSIRQNGGLTVTTTRGIRGGPKLDADAIVYAVADHGTPQHEAVHAYCGITFGQTGPTWYSEGMAEVGQYWREGELGVNASQPVINYLKSSQPKPLDEIINNPLERTGDSWQNYAWRWVVCHLLGFNKNYSDRFKPLGMSLLTDGRSNFETVYGSQFKEIEFEYRLFLRDLEPGYRCDLCSWDWKARFKRLKGKSLAVSKIHAARGWQASKAILEAGETYQVVTSGEWRLQEEGEEVTAAGDSQGRGKLVGIIFDDYQLSEPFEIGSARTFEAPSSGQLFLRCGDDWGALVDNDGTLTVRIGRAQTQAAR